jgi:RND family efflux transporter MFP subunit
MKLFLLALFTLNIFAQESYIVKKELHNVYFKNDGHAEAINRAKLSAQTSGIVTYLGFDVGDTFKKGDTLLKISSISQFSDMEESKLALENAILDRDEKKRKYIRVKKLDEKNLAKDEDMTAAKTAYDVAEKTILLKKEILSKLQEVYSYTVVKAPFDGIVETRFVKLAEKIDINNELFDIYNSHKMRIIVSIPESMIQKIKKHQMVTVEINEQSYTIDYKNITIFPTSYNYAYTIRVNIPKEISAPFYDGNFVNVKFKIGEENAIYLSEHYIHQEYETSVVYLKKNDHTYRQFVRLGNRFDNKIKILSGVQNGDTIVSHAN